MNDQEKWFMDMADYSIKVLFLKYFANFRDDCVIKWCNDNKVDINNIPEEYKIYANKIKNNKEFLFTPKTEKPFIQYIWNREQWKLDITLVGAQLNWIDELSNSEFVLIVEKLTLYMHNLLEFLKKRYEYKSLLSSFVVLFHADNVTIEVRDLRFSKVSMPFRIGFLIERLF